MGRGCAILWGGAVMDNTDKAFNRIKQDLDKVSAELVDLINKYEMVVDSPLDIIAYAKKSIQDPHDYIRFLELSLQGRLLGEAIEYISIAEKYKPPVH